MAFTRRRIGTHATLLTACAAAMAIAASPAPATGTGRTGTATAAGTVQTGTVQAGTAAAGAVQAGGPVRIMPLGDSITMGIGSQTMSSYRADLYRRLTAAGVAVDFVGTARDGTGRDLDHEGHSGWTIDKISRSVDQWLMQHSPDVVLLHIGTNDMRQDATAKGAAGRLSLLIDQIRFRRPAAQIFVATLVGAKRPEEQRRIDAYNAQVPGVVAAKDRRVHLVDQSTVDELDIRDNLHPNDFGFAKMSWNWYNALQRVLRPAGATAWPSGANPYRQTRAYLCHLVATYPNGVYRGVIRCGQFRKVTQSRRVGGRPTTVTRWLPA